MQRNFEFNLTETAVECGKDHDQTRSTFVSAGLLSKYSVRSGRMSGDREGWIRLKASVLADGINGFEFLVLIFDILLKERSSLSSSSQNRLSNAMSSAAEVDLIVSMLDNTDPPLLSSSKEKARVTNKTAKIIFKEFMPYLRLQF